MNILEAVKIIYDDRNKTACRRGDPEYRGIYFSEGKNAYLTDVFGGPTLTLTLEDLEADDWEILDLP